MRRVRSVGAQFALEVSLREAGEFRGLSQRYIPGGIHAQCQVEQDVAFRKLAGESIWRFDHHPALKLAVTNVGFNAAFRRRRRNQSI